ncbi:MAG: hypothetical protein JXR62_07135 [Bacilli bacterium]|nr:hypothetical protein [Bacilli bacterium]
MKKYFDFLLIYSIGGFLLERIINLVFYGKYFDNSVLIGPYQPLYGSGILMAIIIKDLIIDPKISNKIKNSVLLLITAIITTAIAEAVTGYGYAYLYNAMLWDYREFFPCAYPYVCIIPTTLFGIFSFLAIKYFHPFIESFEKIIPTYISFIAFVIFILDIISTFFILS